MNYRDLVTETIAQKSFSEKANLLKVKRWQYLLGSTFNKEYGVIEAMQEQVKSLPILKRYVTLSIVIRAAMFTFLLLVVTFVILPSLYPDKTLEEVMLIPVIIVVLGLLILGPEMLVYNTRKEALIRRKELAPCIVADLEERLQQAKAYREKAYEQLRKYDNPSDEDIRVVAYDQCGIVSSKLTSEQLKLFWSERGMVYRRSLADSANYNDALIQRLAEEIEFLKTV